MTDQGKPSVHVKVLIDIVNACLKIMGQYSDWHVDPDAKAIVDIDGCAFGHEFQEEMATIFNALPATLKALVRTLEGVCVENNDLLQVIATDACVCGVVPVNISCPVCRGGGYIGSGENIKSCSKCHGTGLVKACLCKDPRGTQVHPKHTALALMTSEGQIIVDFNKTVTYAMFSPIVEVIMGKPSILILVQKDRVGWVRFKRITETRHGGERPVEITLVLTQVGIPGISSDSDIEFKFVGGVMVGIGEG